jgi:hypothetical protein
MLSSQITNSSKPFPDFIRHSAGLYPGITIEKVFPKIGLPNSKESIDVKFDFTHMKLDRVIHLAVNRYIAEFNNRKSLEEYQGLELFNVARILYILGELNRRFSRQYGLDIDDNSVCLSDAIPSCDGKVLVKAGTDCFKLVQELFVQGAKYAKVELVSHDKIAEQCKNLEIVFSSSELNGAWDLATMSMRGIKSCMRWEARQSLALVGSITDPCCGIIYLTNGTKTQYGSKMLFRALVRVVIHAATGEPALLVDRLYSSFYKNKPQECNKLDEQVKQLFVKYLRDKLPKATILECIKDKHVLDSYTLPIPSNHFSLMESERSYRDTPINYYANYRDVEHKIIGAFETKVEKILKVIKPKKKLTKAKSKASSLSLKG